MICQDELPPSRTAPETAKLETRAKIRFSAQGWHIHPDIFMSLYGKHFGSMYKGSMVGKGAVAFALMGYVIAEMRCQWTGVGRAKMVTEARVHLNVSLLSAIFGEPMDKIQAGIDFLCSPDEDSQSREEDGRRLLKIGQFEYRVVNAPYYQNLKDQDDFREKSKERQRRYRESKGLPPLQTVTLDPFGGNEDPPETRPKKFTPPTLEDLKLLMAKSGLPAAEAEKFFNYYGSNGWRVGRNPMKSLPHAVANWAANVRQGTFVKNVVSKNNKPDYSKGF